MESIIVIVGFLGAGKTTLLRQLIESALDAGLKPFVILNDYANANVEADQLSDTLSPSRVSALNGSCICCDGIGELRESVNRIPERENGITLIEANGTSDAVRLMGFLGVGLDERFQPPIQVSVVDVKNWQKRGEQNDLEANQIQVSSLVVLTHLDRAAPRRRAEVEEEIKALNPHALVLAKEEVNQLLLQRLNPNSSTPTALDHQRAHWASCSVDLPVLPSLYNVREICEGIDPRILRVKGCAKVGQDEGYTYFERCADGEVYVRAYRGTPVTGPKLLVVGPGSDPANLQELVARSVESAQGAA